MSIEINKWQKDLRGAVYKVTGVVPHPARAQICLELEIIESVFDFSKRSSNTRYEMTVKFYSFYLDKDETTLQEVADIAYKTFRILNQMKHEAELGLKSASITAEQKGVCKEDMRLLAQKFKFLEESKTFKAPSVKDFEQFLELPDNIHLDVTSAY